MGVIKSDHPGSSESGGEHLRACGTTLVAKTHESIESVPYQLVKGKEEEHEEHGG